MTLLETGIAERAYALFGFGGRFFAGHSGVVVMLKS